MNSIHIRLMKNRINESLLDAYEAGLNKLELNKDYNPKKEAEKVVNNILKFMGE